MSQWILQQRAMMDFERYGLTDSPFGGPGSRDFVLVTSRAAQLHRIEQCLCDGQGIAVLTGSAGLGKTTVCRKLSDRLHPDWLVANLCDAGFTTRRSLLQAILYELGLPYTGLTEQEARLHLVEAIRDRQPHKAGLILIVDEAQRLNDRLLEELRLLINHERDGDPLIRLMLCGDLVLEERLITPALEAVNQRVVCHEILEPLTYEESAQVIEEKLTRVGGDGWEHVFTRPAMELLCLVSDGSPRNLEQLAKRSLQIASDRREPRIAVESVREALDELKELPLQWNEPANLDAYAAREQRLELAPEDDADVEPLLPATDDAQADDAVAVQVGDELPAAGWESVLDESLEPAAAVYEVGAALDEELSSSSDVLNANSEPELDQLFTRGSHEVNLLLDDDAPGLADTAILTTGQDVEDAVEQDAAKADADAVGASAVYETSPGDEVVLDEEASVILPVQPDHHARVVAEADSVPDWTEYAIDDAYAALDARLSTSTESAIGHRTAPVEDRDDQAAAVIPL
ncbi:MAG: AAA family ATPase, partial [Planctomycetaceae bacterium]|nr:AAA family ATPase [Planctomycetaceae bacterium]